MIKRIKQLISILFKSPNAESVNKNTDTDNLNEDRKLAYARSDKLLTNDDWLELAKIWKRLKKLPSDASINDQKSNFSEVLNSLKNESLLTSDEATLLKKHFLDRIEDLQNRNYPVKCYKTSDYKFKTRIRRQDLEKRYQLLEKLFSQDKISTKTFQETKKKIEEDLKFIYKEPFANLEHKDIIDLIEIIASLNK